MHKLSVKDFKYYDKQVELVSCDTKKLVAILVLTENRIVYHVIEAGSNIISVFNTLEEAIEKYNGIM